MLPRKLLVVAAVGAVGAVVAAGVVRFVEPGVDRLAMALGIGITAGPATPEAEQLAADWYRLLEPTNVIAGVALWLVVLGGMPLACVAVVAEYSPRFVAPLVRSKTALWVCLTWQLTSIGFPVFLALLIAFDTPDRAAVLVALVATAYVTLGLLAARVWRELLRRMDAAAFTAGRSSRRAPAWP